MPFIYLSIYVSVYLVHVSMDLSVCLSVCLFTYLKSPDYSEVSAGHNSYMIKRPGEIKKCFKMTSEGVSRLH